jgi:pimeloyl-ACP methyl ester carboxylesterase/DNA-binding CsgD family transcriptional regulator
MTRPIDNQAQEIPARLPSRILPDPEFLQAVYQTAVTPENYDALMGHWQTQMERALESLPPEALVEAPGSGLIDVSETLPHFATSAQILDKLGRTSHDGISRHAVLRDGLHMLADTEGRIVWHNARAARLLRLRSGTTLEALPITPETRARLQAALISGADGARQASAIAFVLTLPDSDPQHMVAAPIVQGDGQRLLVLRSATSRWTPLLAEMMREAFALSIAEIDVISLLVDGYDLPEIALARDRKLNTVRTQLKAILRKTHTRSQAQIIRLALSLAAHLPDTGEGERRRTEVAFLTLPCGRRMPWRSFGPADGRPVLFLHGMLDGISILDPAHDLLHRFGLRIIAPERPFFGSAAGSPLAPSKAVEGFADDLDALCAHLQLPPTVVLGHMAGSVYAFGLAARHPRRVRAIVNVSGGVPILSPRQFDMMSPRQRVVAFTARYAPAALPFILRAGIRQIDAGGERRFVAALYQNSPSDQAALRQQDIFEIVTDGVRYAVEQGHHAFEIDSYHVVRDWSRWVDQSACPVHLVHGRNDPVVAADTVQEFHDRLGARSTLQIIEDVGQLVYYVRPETVFKTVSAAFATPP